MVAALLQVHALTHPQATAPPSRPKLNRPHIDCRLYQETWNAFFRRWETFHIGSNITDAAASNQLYQCCSESEALGDILLKADPDLTTKPIKDVKAAMHSIVVIPISKGVIRAELMQLTQNADELFRTFAGRVKGKAETCWFSMEYKCGCDKTLLIDYTTETIRDVLLSDINDIDIQRETLGTHDMQKKTINDIISFVEGREMARNSIPAVSVSALKRTYTPKPQMPLPTEGQKNATCANCKTKFHPFKEKPNGTWNTRPHKLCLDCRRATTTRRRIPATDQNANNEILSVEEESQIKQISTFELTSKS